MKPNQWPDEPPPETGGFRLNIFLGLLAVCLIAVACLTEAVQLIR